MEIFKGRPMALIGALGVVATLLGFYADSKIKMIILVSAAILLPIICLLFVFRKWGTYRGICVVLGIVIICGLMLRSWYCVDVEIGGAAGMRGEGQEITGTVTERKYSSSYGSTFLVNVSEVNGEETKLKAVLSCHYPSDLQIGYTFCISNVTVEPVEDVLEEYVGYYIADGIYICLTSESEQDCVIIRETGTNMMIGLKRLNDKLASLFYSGIGGDEGGLAAAMLLRNTAGLNDHVRRDFARSGVSHLLAVSGLHMTVMTGIVGWILRKTGMHRSAATALLGAFVLGYLSILGFPLSAVRAAVMLGIVYLSYFLGFDPDGLNSLGIAVLGTLFVSPSSIFDIGFILSYSATLGIVAILPVYNKAVNEKREKVREKEMRNDAWEDEGEGKSKTQGKEKEKDKENGKENDREKDRENERRSIIKHQLYRLKDMIVRAILTVLCAQMLTLLTVAVYNGETSLAVFFTNLILCPVATLFLFLCTIFLPFAGVPFVSGFIAFYLRKTAAFMLWATAKISLIEGVCVSLRQPFAVYILIPMTVVSVILLVIKLRHKWLVVMPMAAAMVTFAVCFSVFSNVGNVEMISLFDHESANEGIVITRSGSDAVLIDMSSGSYSSLETLIKKARQTGATEISALVLTHYHLKHETSVTRFMESERVRRLWIPYPETEADLEVAMKLCEAAASEDSSCECVLYHARDDLTVFGDVSLKLSGPVRISRSTHPVIAISVSRMLANDEYKVSYIGSSAWEGDGELMSEFTENADVLIFGSHGPVIKSGFHLPAKKAEIVTVSGKTELPWILCPEGDVFKRRDLTEVCVGGTEEHFWFPEN